MRLVQRSAALGFVLFAGIVLLQAQETKEHKGKNTGGANAAQQQEQRQHQQATPQQHTPPPQNVQRTAPTGQQDSRPQHRSEQSSQPEQTHTAPSRRSTPTYTSPTQPVPKPQSEPLQAQPAQRIYPPQERPSNQSTRPEPYRTPQGNGTPGNSAQPGRTFGIYPSNRPAEASPVYNTRPSPPPAFTTRTGDVVHRDNTGQIRQVRMSNGSVVYHPPNAPRRVEVVRPGGRVVVATAPGHGYVQRQVVIQNTTVIKRTYVYQGVPQARFYRPHVYNGVSLVVYTPVRYYRPAFYVYAYNPWPRPIVYTWGWGGSPWYGYYGGYFTPYPVYASPSLWLTDYLVAATLEAAYEERMAARSVQFNSYADSGATQPMTPEVKAAIADEVRRQLEQERMESQSANIGSAPDTIFSDNQAHVFVVHATFAVNSNAGECSISEGDVLQMRGAPAPNATFADLVVLSSRGADCRKGSTVSLNLKDVQDMHDQMRATLERGLGDMQAKQGKAGMPRLPQGVAGTVDTPYAQEAQPDPGANAELTAVNRDVDRAEQQVIAEAGDNAAPLTLSAGMSIDEVRAIQGEPQKIVDLGSKKIYVYKDLKITFIDGKVTDIE